MESMEIINMTSIIVIMEKMLDVGIHNHIIDRDNELVVG